MTTPPWRVLVTGGTGQVATALRDILPAAGVEALVVGRPDFDFDRPDGIAGLVERFRPDAVVNAAAWTAVDAAEAEEAAARRANAEGPAVLAAACARAGIPLLHLSTDYVFDGNKGSPYHEEDATNPSSVYGRTKLAGEVAVLGAHERTMVLRTSWVFAASGRNFVRTMLAAGATRPVLRVVGDQHGCPTAAPDLADAMAALLLGIRDGGWQPAYRGVFHAAGAGDTTWHGLAIATFELAAARGGPRPEVQAIATADWPTPAPRPTDARLDCARLREVFGLGLPPWQAGLARVIGMLPMAGRSP